ncbi:MAG: class B sortase [Lachnospiraceae bacterium]|nr:class B sortase [Lachnospiraceae bacterium]
MKEKNRKRIVLLRILMGGCVAVFLLSGFLLVRDFVQTRRQQETFEQLGERFSQTSKVMETEPEKRAEGDTSLPLQEKLSPQEWKEQQEKLAEERFLIYRSMKEENSDMVGWIRIEGTNIDYPVMQNLDQPDYYLHHDFYKKKSSYGTPYLSAICRYEEPRTSLMISGHHMKNGSMFASLQNYTEKDYFWEHPYVQFDTIDEAGSYEVAAVIKLSASGDQTMWQNLLFPQAEGEFEQAWERIQSYWFYDTGVSLKREDELLALVTCEYTLKDGRILVIARRIR